MRAAKILITIFLLLISAFAQVQALTITNRADLGFDDSLAKEEQVYGLPDSIIVAPIVFPVENISMDTSEWIKGLHYYSIMRLGYPEIPFHYVVTSSGTVYKTNRFGDEAKVTIADSEEKPILIAYLVEEDERDFNDEARKPLTDLMLEVANTNSIKPANISLANVRFKLNTQTRLAVLEKRAITGNWNQTFKTMAESVAKNYKPKPKNYSVSVVEVKSPTSPLQPGQSAIIEIKLKNTGEYSIYGDSDSALLANKQDGKLSKFFLNGVWASQSQVIIMGEEDILKPQEEKVFQVKFNVPLYFGNQTENFYIANLAGTRIVGTDFPVTINVASISATVVEILPTETGYLNVRASDSGSSAVIAKVNPGQRYIQKATGRGGYIQLDLGEGKSGWVSQKYVKVVN